MTLLHTGIRSLLAVGRAAPFVLLLGCGSEVGELAAVAESTRSATERLAIKSEQVNEARERQALADALEMQEQASARAKGASGLPRYAIRKDGAGWTVYDVANQRAVRRGAKPQTGLARRQAEELFAELQQDDEQFSFRRAGQR